MSDRELGRLEVLRDLDHRRLTSAAAAQLLGLERRQVFRLLKVYRTDGSDGSDLKAARLSEQSTKARGASKRGAGNHPRALLGFWADFGRREVARGARAFARSRDAAVMDDRGWDLG